MIIEILVLLVTIIVAYFFYSHKRLQWYFEERGVKFVPGLPLFGNLLGSTLLKKHFTEEMDEVYNAFPDERYMGFLEMTLPVILIRDPDLIKSILVKDFDHFVDHKEFFTEQLDPLFSGSLFSMKGDKWRDMRTTLSPAFTASKMKFMLPFIVDISNNIIEYLHDHEGQDIDVDDLIRRYTNDVIASAGFGLQVNSLKDRKNDFYTSGDQIFDFNIRQRLLMMLFAQFPQIAKKFNCRLFPERIYTFFSKIVASTIEYRKTNKVERPDMIQLLMEAKQEWTTDALVSQVFIFFTAGFETSASALTLSIHELALNEDVQEKVYQECKQFKEENQLTFENLIKLKYLDGVINETLRKWSPAIFLDRLCTKTYELPPPREGGKPYVLNPGDTVYNMVNQVQMDPKYWPEPHKYDPSRFLDENKHKIKPFTFMPFGVGPRGCIGTRFAVMEVKVLLYLIITNFKIVKTAKTSDPIRLYTKSFTIKNAVGTFVKFERRVSN